MEKEMENLQIKNLYDYKRRLSIAVHSAKMCIFEVDVGKQLYTFFENSEAIFGVTGEEILKDVRSFSALPADEYQKRVTEYFVHPDDTEAVEQAFEAIFRGDSATYEARMRAGHTGYVWCRIHVTPTVEADGTVKMVGLISNIQSEKEKMDLLFWENQLDSFTRLYSKKRFEELCTTILEEKPDEKMALFMIDLDDFKVVNDKFGHQEGDKVLLSVAENLKKLSRKKDILSRFGGDEFVILMRDIKGPEEAIQKARQYMGVDNCYGVTKSIGIAFYPDNGRNYKELLKKSDKALYRAKQTKNTFVEAQNE